MEFYGIYLLAMSNIAIENDHLGPKEVWKLNFRQYGQMEKHHSHGSQPRRRSEMKKVRREKMPVSEKVRKSRSTVFPMFCGSGGSKSRLAKAAGAEAAGQMKDEKLHAVVARSTLGSKKCQNTSGSEYS